MGCCLSARDRNTEAEHRRSIDGEPPTSPPGIIEVETVKEVLLETPVVAKADDKIRAMPPGNQEWKAEARPAAVINGHLDAPRKDDGDIVSEVSEISEMCSYSESLSTTAALEKSADVDDGVVDQRPPPRKRRAHGGGRGMGDRVVARRTAAPSPEKRGQVAPLRPVRGRPVAPQPRNGAEENGNAKRKDPVEGSGRKSRSPVRREEVAPPRNESDQKTPAPVEPRNDVVPADEVESLENPVVSLECFIFL
ncbi:hypothetical protein C2S51_036454 [Perilla frutescens var. frutescens]|nr:hypothetical protein C2S51_036454 [Perilla frutescens var. frutescens]